MNSKIANGAALPKNWSGNTDRTGSDHSSTRWQLLLLCALGFAGVALHATFHWPLKLPGHHGLEWMAILMFARCASTLKWSASITAGSAALVSTLPAWGFSEPLVPLFYLLSGVVLDIGYRFIPGVRASLLWLGVIAALAHASKPVSRYFIASLSDLHFGSLAGGLAFPLSTHLMFGLVGGLAGAVAWKLMRKKRR
jgi:hypothetical protein